MKARGMSINCLNCQSSNLFTSHNLIEYLNVTDLAKMANSGIHFGIMESFRLSVHASVEWCRLSWETPFFYFCFESVNVKIFFVKPKGIQ